MIRLFVDCDDTLILYKDTQHKIHPYGAEYGLAWTANEVLIKYIERFRESFPEALITIWSGGGKEYAQKWIDRLLPDVCAISMTKGREAFMLIKTGDIVIDDQPLNIPTGNLHLPDDARLQLLH